jgi:hypothetical protein
MCYDHGKQEEERTGKQIDELMKQSEAVDAEEDEEFGADNKEFNLPEELQIQGTKIFQLRISR